MRRLDLVLCECSVAIRLAKPTHTYILAQKWKAEKAEEPEFANDPPTLEEAYRSVTDTDPWAKAEGLLQDGLSMQQVYLPCVSPAAEDRKLVPCASSLCGTAENRALVPCEILESKRSCGLRHSSYGGGAGGIDPLSVIDEGFSPGDWLLLHVLHVHFCHAVDCGAGVR